MAFDSRSTEERFIAKSELSALFAALSQRGYAIIGPTVAQGAIVYDELTDPGQLPQGWTDEQGPGSYRLKPRDDDQLFGFVVGPHSWKRFLFPPRATVGAADLTPNGWEFSTPPDEARKFAFVGVRACEIAAIHIQDQVFMSDAHVDPVYQRRRQQTLLIAVNCTQAAATCFCTSMNTGPQCTHGFDLALTEIAEGFTVESGTAAGDELLEELSSSPATDSRQQAAQAARDRAVQQIQRKLDTTDIHDLLLSNLDHRQWDVVADRCLSCTNCTMVCPTCFCSSVEEVTDLAGEHVERERQWDSCFNPAFSYIVGGNVRNNVRARYRQWLTHKLATWIDQFGESGCVGCGRCIAWCPPGIDLTEEVAAIRAGDARDTLTAGATT